MGHVRESRSCLELAGSELSTRKRLRGAFSFQRHFRINGDPCGPPREPRDTRPAEGSVRSLQTYVSRPRRI